MKNYIEAWELSKQLDHLIIEQSQILRKSLRSKKSSFTLVDHV